MLSGVFLVTLRMLSCVRLTLAYRIKTSCSPLFFLFPLFAWLGNIVMYHLLFSCTLHMIMHYLFSFFFWYIFCLCSSYAFISMVILFLGHYFKISSVDFFFTLLSLKHCTRSLWGDSGASLRKPRPPISRSLRQAGKMPHSQAWFVVLHYV